MSTNSIEKSHVKTQKQINLRNLRNLRINEGD